MFAILRFTLRSRVQLRNYEFRSRFRAPSEKSRPKGLQIQAGGMKTDAYVVHRSWGFGQIKSFDDTTLRLVIDFKGRSPRDGSGILRRHDGSPAANHLLVRKETEPKKIQELIADNPAQLIVEALESYPNKATTPSTWRSPSPRWSERKSSRSGGPRRARR